MKILYLCGDAGIPVLGRKGASIHIREMISAFARAGHKVVLAAQVLNKSVWETSTPAEASVVHVRSNANTSAAIAAFKDFTDTIGTQSSLPGELRRILFNHDLHADLKKRFEADAPDFIYERGSLYGTAGVSLACHFNVPLLWELNAPLAIEQSTYRSNGFGSLAANTEQWTATRADAVLTVSEQLRKHVLRLGADSRRVHVTPNAIDPTAFLPAPRDPAVAARWGLGDGPVIGFVGGLRPWHGLERLPGLLARLVRIHKNLKLIVAGDGPLRADLERAFKTRGLREHAVFTGSLPHRDIPALIRNFTIALAPYPKLEHDFYFSPLKVYEYMGCGVPVVASKCGQLARLIRHGKTGLLCDAGNQAALAAACDRLLKDERLRSSIGRASAKLIHTHYTWDHNAKRAIALAETLIRARKKPS
jgi:glycosyltransferase involved in cell wall biosynthesis